jgi:uncharacterized RDD family membrane protein YckC
VYQLIQRGARLGDEVLGVQDGRIVRISSRIEEGAGREIEVQDAWLATVVAWASPWAAIISLLLGVVMTWLLLYGLVAPLQGPIARALNSLDLSWLTGGLLYYALYKLGMVTPRAGNLKGT